MKKLYNKVNREVLKRQLLEKKEDRTTLSFYRYGTVLDPQQLRDELYAEWSTLGIFGRVYVANEGINAQLSVLTEKMDDFRSVLWRRDWLNGVRLNVAIEDDGKSFFKLTIKVRQKLVADGLNDDFVDLERRGEHLDARGFNELTDGGDTLVVDMRNHYESEVGHMRNAVCPDVETFREGLKVVEEILEAHRDKNIVMYCTGGIRCEKASAYFKGRGFEKVYQLDGGIIEYARQVVQQGLENKFLGKNFVFDERLGERIGGEVIANCHQCGKECDIHTNCANDACHILFIQCVSCGEKMEGCCSANCLNFSYLDVDEQVVQRKAGREFNGTRFGKGRYKAFKSEDGELLS